MTRERLMRLIAAYGADPRRWPEDERAEALALQTRLATAGSAAERAELREALSEAADLDGVLSGASAGVPDAAMSRLTAAVAFPPPRQQQAARSGANRLRGLLDLIRAAFQPGAAAAAAMAMLGIVVGLSIEPAYSYNDTDYVVTQSTDTLLQSIDDVGFGSDEGAAQ